MRFNARLDVAARELDEYFAGTRTTFDFPLDLQLTTGFQRQVLERLQSVPFARTISYGQLGKEISSPRAARAVGTACARNPMPLVLPCHRVVHSDGTPADT
jgi:methylated-DNA-[protein]-cysteine S-methyltransferase